MYEKLLNDVTVMDIFYTGLTFIIMAIGVIGYLLSELWCDARRFKKDLKEQKPKVEELTDIE
jgi:hypothetical protein